MKKNQCQTFIEYDYSAVACIVMLQQVHSPVCSIATVSSEKQQERESNENRRNQSQESDDVSEDNRDVRQNIKSIRLPQFYLTKFNGDEHASPVFWVSHRQTLHGDVNAMLTDARQKYWIIKCRLRMKYVLNQCIRCKNPTTEPFAKKQNK